ncbi:hypothetical protein IKZ70_03665 [bacterium]|nr:hypothetical protein [bacterium]
MKRLKKILPWLALLTLLVLAAYLRFYHVSWRGLTYDECLSEERSHWTLWHIWRYYITARAPVNALIYYVNGHIFPLITGHPVLREWQLRLPSALFSLCTIPFLFLLGRRLKDSLAGLLLAALGTASLLLVIHAREARYYSFLVFFSTVLIYEASVILLKAGDSEKTIRNYALYSLCALCGLGSHQGFYILFVFSNVFLFCHAALPFVTALLKKKGDFSARFELFYKQFVFLAMPCVAYCYQFIITTSTDKPYTPTGHGGAHLIPELTWRSVSAVVTELWQGYPFAEYVLLAALAAFVLLLFTRARLVACYAFFVKASTFVFLRIATQRLTYEEFRAKYIIFVLVIDMLLVALAAGYLADWLPKAVTLVFLKWPNFRKKAETALSCALILAAAVFVCRCGVGAAQEEEIFNEQLEDVRYVFDYLENAYSPGDVVIFQAEPNSWVHKNCLYEKSLRDYAKNWIVSESTYMPFMKDNFTKKGCYVWWMIMYAPIKGFNPYFYDGMRAFGADVNKKNAMLMCRSAVKINNLPDAAFLTVLLYHFSNLRKHPQYEKHLIDECLKGQNLENSAFSNYIAKTVSTGKFCAPKFDDIFSDPKLEFYAYRIINDWYGGMKEGSNEKKPLLVSPLERAVYNYLSSCASKNLPSEEKNRLALMRLKRGWWHYDRIYRFTHEEFPRPYIPPNELENYLSLEEIYKNRVRFDAVYITLNPDMAKDWNKLLKRARDDYNERKHGKKLQDNP